VNASDPNNVITDQQTPSHTFLKAASEILDGSGNGNGLCESGENCFFNPNRGSYQGEGNYLTQTCQFTGGNGVTNVTMYGYPVNGD
jgi:hypothetical protein